MTDLGLQDANELGVGEDALTIVARGHALDAGPGVGEEAHRGCGGLGKVAVSEERVRETRSQAA